MPAIGALFSRPTSVSRNGKVLTNLRGVNTAIPYDFSPSKIALAGGAISQVSSSGPDGEGAWANTIKYAYEATSEAAIPYINYSALLSAATTFTIFIRLYIKELTGVTGTNETIFYNGFEDPPNYTYNGFLLNFNRTSNRLTFDLLNGSQVQISNVTLLTNTWYHYGLKVATDATSTKVKVWENGTYIDEFDLTIPMIPATGSTSLFSTPGPVYGFFGGITDFAFIEGTDITDAQMPAFAVAPFV